MHRLALFDIDCTLIDAHGAGGRAIVLAIGEVYEVGGPLDGYSYHGRTDPQIVRDLAARWGAPAHRIEELVQPCLERYVELLRGEIAEGFIEVLPGVKALLTALATDRRVVLGLLTGNVADGARAKLAPTGLAGLFKVVAFGSDSGIRAELPAVAVERARALTGQRFSGKQIAVIGDTPADITCGEQLGVKTVAVATARHTLDELAAHQPDYLFASLSDWRQVYAAILA